MRRRIPPRRSNRHRRRDHQPAGAAGTVRRSTGACRLPRGATGGTASARVERDGSSSRASSSAEPSAAEPSAAERQRRRRRRRTLCHRRRGVRRRARAASSSLALSPSWGLGGVPPSASDRRRSSSRRKSSTSCSSPSSLGSSRVVGLRCAACGGQGAVGRCPTARIRRSPRRTIRPHDVAAEGVSGHLWRFSGHLWRFSGHLWRFSGHLWRFSGHLRRFAAQEGMLATRGSGSASFPGAR